MKAPVRIYLDQNIASNLAKSSDWLQEELGAILNKAKNDGTGEVWISPSHVVETALASDPEIRRRLADFLLHVSDAGRMADSSDMILVVEFGNFLNQFVPGSFDSEPFITAQREDDQRFWLGTLGLLAWKGPLRSGPGVAHARLTKFRTQLLASRILANPDQELDEIIKSAQTFASTNDADPLDIDSLSEVELIAEISRLKALAKKPSQAILTKAQKHRAEICSVYGAVGIGSALRSVFQKFPLYLPITFDCSKLAAGWSTFTSKFGVSQLPTEITEASADTQRYNSDFYPVIINACIRIAAQANLCVATAGYYSLVREIEVCVNQGKLPTPGATIDSDHVVCAVKYDVFITDDGILGSTLKTAAKGMGRDFEVVSNAKQLAKAIASASKTA